MLNIENLLFNCEKPSRYSGGEFMSSNKDFDSASSSIALAFPDKYEIGISNFGHRILYYMINNIENFAADRVYAPEIDFKELLQTNNQELYGLESKKPLKEFNYIGFSLQYEMSYTTVLKMLEMSNIALRSKDRDQMAPIIIAGGPCAFNPCALAPFMDAFIIGDGEDALLEILAVDNSLNKEEKLKIISTIEGVWVPSINKTVKKRIKNLENDNHPLKFPIPFSQCVHDRAVIEVRRGCSRLCRFCQSAHTNLPVRERKAQDIIELAKKTIENTGYDEYSLLSLSSNDYTNIEFVVDQLNNAFSNEMVSPSLPSQRADKFNENLAGLLAKYRKSSITLAPEAGSQRLRDVINKNLTKEQIINSTLSAYNLGWNKIKYYFMIGLPTETFEDLDEIIFLLDAIKYRAGLLRKEKGFSRTLEITCSISPFVPKPHTPFQWFGANSTELIKEKMYYLKDKGKRLKGVKLNVHSPKTTMLESYLARADFKAADLIEKMAQSGVYLESWDENFNLNLWLQNAQELGIDIEKEAQRDLKTDEELCWDFVNVGLNKSWLIEEYQKAKNEALSPGCEGVCVNCGVCMNLGTKKVLDKKI